MIHIFVRLRQTYLFRRPVILFLLLYVLGILAAKRAGIFDLTPPDDPSLNAGRLIKITGVVAAPPDVRPKACVYIIETESLQPLDPWETPRSAQGQVLAYLSPGRSGFASPGDRVQMVGHLQSNPEARIPGVFDYGEFLKTRGITSLLYGSEHSAVNLGNSHKHPFIRWGWSVQQTAARVFSNTLPPEEAAVLSGLALGIRPRFHPEIRRIFIESGTMHILVASGSNIAFVVALWYLLMRLLFRLPRMWSLLTSLPAVWGYVLLVGADAPIVRAGTMTTVGLIGYAIAREDRAFHALALAALSLLIPSPQTLFDVGFQMSFLTVFGLLYFLPALHDVAAPTKTWQRWLLQLSAATVTAQIWLFPITAAVFKRFFPLSLLSNLFVLPLAEAGLTAGLLLTLFKALQNHVAFFSPLLSLGVLLTHHYLRLLIRLVTFFASFQKSVIWLSPPTVIWTIGFYLLCFSIVKIKSSWLAQASATAALLVVLFPLISKKNAAQTTLAVTWIDVGRQLAALVQTPDGKNILFNPGPKEPFDSSERVLLPFLLENHVRSLDAIIITHLNPALSSGWETIANGIHVSTVIFCGGTTNKYRWGNLIGEAIDGSKRFETDTPFLLHCGSSTLLLAGVLSLTSQAALIEKKLAGIDVFQARFSGKLRWRDDFIERFHPTTLIETGYDNERNPSEPPWTNATMVVPQKVGWWRWTSGAGEKAKSKRSRK